MNVLEMRTNKFGNSNSINGFDARFWETSNYKPNTTYAMTLTEMPDGYRLATDEDKKGTKPSWYMHTNLSSNGFMNGGQINGFTCDWRQDTIYIVPIETDTDRKRKEIENEIKEAQYKLEIAQSKLKELN